MDCARAGSPLVHRRVAVPVPGAAPQRAQLPALGGAGAAAGGGGAAGGLRGAAAHLLEQRGLRGHGERVERRRGACAGEPAALRAAGSAVDPPEGPARTAAAGPRELPADASYLLNGFL